MAYKQTGKAIALNTGLGTISPYLAMGQVAYGTYDSLSQNDYPYLIRDVSPSTGITLMEFIRAVRQR